MKKSLAALFVGGLVLLPRVGLAQTLAADRGGPLDIDTVPAEQRDLVWDAQAKKNDLSINLFPPAAGLILSAVSSSLLGSAGFSFIMLPVEYERALSRGMSVFWILQPSFAADSDGVQWGWRFLLGVGLGARAYFSGNAPLGFWLGGEGDIPIYPTSGDGFGADTAVRVESGYNLMFSNNLMLSLGGGLGLSYSNAIDPNTNAPYGLRPAVGLRIVLGYAFS